MADDSSGLDELVQVSSSLSAATNNTGGGAPSSAHSSHTRTTADTHNKASSSSSSATTTTNTTASASFSGPNNSQTLDDSTTNGFTTAPATSDDDFDSDDDDDSRSMCSNKNTSNSGHAATPGARYSNYRSNGRYAIQGEQKRSHHNVLERKRRDLLKDSFAALRESVPMGHSKERVSRAEILKQAAEYIKATVKRNWEVRVELEDLVRANRQFEEKQSREAAALQASGGASRPDGAPNIASSSKVEAGQVIGAPAELTIKQEL